MTSSVLPIRPESASDPPRSAPVVMLDGSGHLTAEVGGKGSSLDVLVHEGFAMPPATTTASRDFVATQELTETLARLRPKLTGAPDDARARRAQSVNVRQDLWSWLRDREELTGEPADRIAERAIAAYRTRLDGGVGAASILSDASNAGG